MTVSLALRESPEVSATIRESVLAECDRQGYRANPMISSWMSLVSRSETELAKTKIAFFTNLKRDPRTMPPHMADLLSGVRQRSAVLGFEVLEFYELKGSGKLREAFREIAALGVRGVMLGPWDRQMDFPSFPWERYCWVCVGHSSEFPVHTVLYDHLQETRRALERLTADGFERIGYVNFASHEAVHSHKSLAAYLEWQEHAKERDQLPFLRVAGVHESRKIGDWIERHSPDCIISPIPLQRTIDDLSLASGKHPSFFQLGFARGGFNPEVQESG